MVDSDLKSPGLRGRNSAAIISSQEYVSPSHNLHIDDDKGIVENWASQAQMETAN